MMEEIAAVHNRRRFIILVFRAFTAHVRESKIANAANLADAFALRMVLEGLMSVVACKNYFKINVPIAELFRKSSISLKVFRALREAIATTQKRTHAVGIVVNILSDNLFKISLKPWHERVVKMIHFDVANEAISKEAHRFTKYRVLLAICIAYNNRKGSKYFTELIQRLIKSNALRQTLWGFADYKRVCYYN
ncbi:hypothetical protein BdWA1_002754 [Babesia duncani]|uniref:Uncharacterized protein n=1 Tax=Babesia duncani TaxID=323732 RepID=A0AAD9PJT8_9APIC|nr:hypothetical protein BdWA1_002754 [Babesia duncani]